MKKHLLFIFIAAFILFCGKTVNCSAAMPKYNMNVHKKVTIRKNSKIKMMVPTGKKIKWKISNTKKASISKKGVLKAKRVGKVKVTAKTSKKRYVCYITIKKKINKAGTDNVYGKVNCVNDTDVTYTIYNKSDEWVTLVLPQLECKVNGLWEPEKRKADATPIGVAPHINIMPKSSYKGKFSFFMYEMGNKEYRVRFNKVYAGPNLKRELPAQVCVLFNK